MIYYTNSLLTFYLKTKQRENHHDNMIQENTLILNPIQPGHDLHLKNYSDLTHKIKPQLNINGSYSHQYLIKIIYISQGVYKMKHMAACQLASKSSLTRQFF